MVVEIHSWTDLDSIRSSPGKDYVLKSDLTSSDSDYGSIASSTANGGDGWEPISNFTGTLDGNGHIIEGLYIDRTAENCGLFTNSGGVTCTIKNLGMENVEVKSGDYCGGIVGRHDDCIIKRCYVTGYIQGSSYSGAIAGVNSTSSGEISDCYAIAEVKSSYAGGIAGFLDSGSNVNRCYASCTFSGSGNEAICYRTGYQTGTPSNCYSDSGSGKTHSTSELQGDEASSNMTALDFSTVWETVDKANDSDTSADSYPTLRDVSRKNQLDYRGIYVNPSLNPVSTIKDTGLKTSTVTINKNPTGALTDLSTTYSNTLRSKHPVSTINGVSNVTVYSTVYSRLHSYPTDTDTVTSSTKNSRSVESNFRDTELSSFTVNILRSVLGSQTDTSTVQSTSSVVNEPVGGLVDTSNVYSNPLRTKTVQSSIDGVSDVIVYSTVYSRVHSTPSDTDHITSSTENVRSVVTTTKDTSADSSELTRSRSLVGSPTDLSTVHSNILRNRYPVSTIDSVSNVTVYSTVFSRVHAYPKDTESVSSKSERVRTTVTTTEDTDSMDSSAERSVKVSGGLEDVSDVHTAPHRYRNISPTIESTDRLSAKVVELFLDAITKRNPATGTFGTRNPATGTFGVENPAEGTFDTENE